LHPTGVSALNGHLGRPNPLTIGVDAIGSPRDKFIRSRPVRFFGTIVFRGLDWAVNRLDRKLT